VLIAHSKYDTGLNIAQVLLNLQKSQAVCSTQGGFVALLSSILEQTELDEVTTFWVFVSLLDNYDLR